MERTAADAGQVKDGALFADVLLALGRMNYTWTNTESLLIHVIAGLARVDTETAAIIFLTLNTPKARMDLVERLAKRKSPSVACRGEVLSLVKQMHEYAKTRNKYNHCIYDFRADGSPASTQLMRVFDEKNTIKYGSREIIDRKVLGNIQESIAGLVVLNSKIWELIRSHRFPY